LAKRANTPHAAAHLLRIIRKLTAIALDQEWIEYDPTYRIKCRPAYKGWKAWSDDSVQHSRSDGRSLRLRAPSMRSRCISGIAVQMSLW
jgi:hypothetical protein